jgi:glutathione synthase/RimK-type ligase-like ATP-grasp enzyme
VTQSYDVTLVTYDKYPDLAPDDTILRREFVRRGASVRTAVWSDPTVDWSASPLALIRATWDYPQRYDEFWRWLARVETQTQLINDVETVRWNSHKRYLHELQDRGVRIAPTIFVDSSVELDLEFECARRDWDDVVIKPCVGGSSYGTRRMRGDEIAGNGARHLRSLLENGEAMVQPFLQEIETAGELACIFIDGEFTHAVRKAPFNSSTVTTSEYVCELSPRDARFVSEIVAGLDRVPAYARVDIVPEASGTILMELELIEPTLYFGLEPSAAPLLAGRVLRTIDAAR